MQASFPKCAARGSSEHAEVLGRDWGLGSTWRHSSISSWCLGGPEASLGAAFLCLLGFWMLHSYRELIQSTFLISLHTMTTMAYNSGQRKREGWWPWVALKIWVAIPEKQWQSQWCLKRPRSASSEEFCFWWLEFFLDLRNLQPLNLTMFRWTAQGVWLLIRHGF